MAYPSVNFSSSSAGQVIVSFTAQYTATSVDFGGGSPSDIRVLCRVLDDSSTEVARGVLSRLNGGCVLVVDYPGSGTWSAVTSFIDRTINGAGSVGATINVKVRLAKR